MKKEKMLFLFIFGLLVVSSIGPLETLGGAGQPKRLSFEPTMNLVVYFINYNESLVDTTFLQNTLPQVINKTYLWEPDSSIYYHMQYQFLFANQSYTNAFNSFIDSHATSDWTSDLNVTALEKQKENFTRMKIFTRKEGTAIDAKATEEYLASHIPFASLPNDNRFFLFVLNLSRFDSGNLDHWFNLTEIDPDSGRARFYWRLEWDYPINYDVKFPYAGFTEKTDIAFIDPTAFQWYLKWRAIWNEMDNPHPSYFNDLDHLLLNASTTTKKVSVVSDTVREWITDWVNNIYNQPKGPVNKYPALGSSMSVQLRVFYNGSNALFPKEKLTWIVNKELTQAIYSNLMKTSSISVTVTFTDINSDSHIQYLLSQARRDYQDMWHIPPPFENWTFYSGYSLFENIYNEPERYFQIGAADTEVMGTIFLLDNASFTDYGIPWAGKLYTGLGGGGKVVILYELDRAFMPDHVTKKAGLSKVLIHEIGHAVGFPHTFEETFTSDFASDVMGYYPGAANFSQLFTESYYRNLVDEKIVMYLKEYNEKYDQWQNQPDLELQNRLYRSWESFNETIKLHAEKKYLEAYNAINTAINRLHGIFTTTNNTYTTSNETTITPSYQTPRPLDTNTGTSFLPVSWLGILTGLAVIEILRKKKTK